MHDRVAARAAHLMARTSFFLALTLGASLTTHAQNGAWPPRWTATPTRTATATATATATPTPTATPSPTGTAPALARFGASFLCWGCALDRPPLAVLRAAGMGSARQRCTYGSPTDYACADAVVGADNTVGVRTVLVGWHKVSTGGRFAPPAGDCTNAQIGAVTTLYTNLATRYAGNSPPLVFQIDNEPDGCGRPQSDYVDTYVAAYNAIRAVQPAAQVAIAGLAYEDTGPFTTAWSVGLYAAITQRLADPSGVLGAVHAYHSYRGRWGPGPYPYRNKVATVQAAAAQVGPGTPRPPYINVGVTECGEQGVYWGRAVQATAVASCVEQVRDDPTPHWIVAPYQAREDPGNPGFGLYPTGGTGTPFPAAQAFTERIR